MDINATSGDIGSNQQCNLTVFKIGQCFSALILTFIAMNRCRFDAVFFKQAYEFISTMFSTAEYQCLLPVLSAGQMTQQACFRSFIDRV